MSDTDTIEEEAPAKRSKLPMIIGIVLALAGGGAGFYATWSGMLLGGDSGAKEEQAEAPEEAPKVAYVSVDPVIVSLGENAGARHLQFRAELEVPLKSKETVQTVLPRVVDVFNSYLRALDSSDLEDRAALTRLRAQLLRRVQVVVGPDHVNDLLVMEFVLN